MKKVLIAGATGYLGRYMIIAFHEAGWQVEVAVRSERKILDLGNKIHRVHIVDFSSLVSLEKAMNGAALVVSSLGITRQKDGMTYMQVDYGFNHNLLAAALAAKVSSFMYISAIDADKHRDVKILDAKERFAQELLMSDINGYVIRPNGFFSDLTEIFHMAEKGRVFIFGDGKLVSNPIHGKDLARYCVQTCNTTPGAYSVGGPSVLSQRDIANMAFRSLKKKPKITGIPIWLAHGLKWLLKHTTSATFHGPIEFFLTVMTIELVAPTFGRIELEEYYHELASKIQ